MTEKCVGCGRPLKAGDAELSHPNFFGGVDYWCGVCAFKAEKRLKAGKNKKEARNGG